jgi:hypothetical protein
MRSRLLLLAVLVAGCRRHTTTAEDCGRILDRITDLELAERGFRDPALAARRRADVRARFAEELAACVGRSAGAGAMACVERARTAEEISHRCLGRGARWWP